jgi:hypothetical protein
MKDRDIVHLRLVMTLYHCLDHRIRSISDIEGFIESSVTYLARQMLYFFYRAKYPDGLVARGEG